MPRRRRLPAPLVVLVAVLALAAVAVAPRGLLRAVAAGELPVVEHVDGPAVSAPAEAPELPGVRPLIAREEDATELAASPTDAPAAEPVGLAEASADRLRAPLPDDDPPPPVPSLRSTDGDRAPPRLI